MNLIEITHPDVEQTTRVPEESLGHWARAGWEAVAQDATVSEEPVASPAAEASASADAVPEPADEGSAAETEQPKQRRRRTT